MPTILIQATVHQLLRYILEFRHLLHVRLCTEDELQSSLPSLLLLNIHYSPEHRFRNLTVSAQLERASEQCPLHARVSAQLERAFF